MNEPQTNALEMALARAADDPAARPEFYRLLLESDVFVLGHMDGAPADRTVQAGEKISIANWQKQDGTPIVPFFASLPSLQRAIREEQGYLCLGARSLFEITRGATLVLNPTLPYGKEFMPQEVEALLDSGVNQVPARRVVQKETRVLLGQPANYPTAMVESLSRFFAKQPRVTAAYLGLMHDAENEEKPHLVIGIQCDGGYEEIVREAGVVASDTAPKGEVVDIVQVEASDSGISEYFRNSVKPFYTRSWRAKLGSLFGGSKH